MPGSAEKESIKSQFYKLAHFAGAIELVDGTHIRLRRNLSSKMIMLTDTSTIE